MLPSATKKAIATRRLRSCWSRPATVIICTGLLSVPADAASWDHAHGDAANSGFADVATDAARQPIVTKQGMGSFASGVGPVIASDGTVYLGSEQGVVWALHPDGSPYWHRALDRPGE
jgi:outer membrane protein assembly factor BamB